MFKIYIPYVKVCEQVPTKIISNIASLLHRKPVWQLGIARTRHIGCWSGPPADCSRESPKSTWKDNDRLRNER